MVKARIWEEIIIAPIYIHFIYLCLFDASWWPSHPKPVACCKKTHFFNKIVGVFDRVHFLLAYCLQ